MSERSTGNLPVPRPSVSQQFPRAPWLRLLALVWLCLVITLTATAYAPEHLNADMLLNSIMSLQRVTLFYWGQNRLLNVLPFLASVITDPLFNLWFVIFFPVTVFFLLLQMMVAWAARSLCVDAATGVQGLIILSSAVLLLLRPVAVAEMAIGHLEYSLSALLVMLVLWLAWSGAVSGRGRGLLIGALLFLALGVNPAALLALGFAVLGRLLYRRVFSLADAGLLGFATALFIFWMMVSRLVASTSYAGLSWQLLPDGLAAVFPALLQLLDAPYLPLLALLLPALLLIRPGQPGEGSAIERMTVLAAAAFALSWTLLFCANRWVALNDFHWRYFIYPLFAVLLVTAFRLVAMLRQIPVHAGWMAAVLLALSAGLKVYQPLRPVTDFSLMQQVQRVEPQPWGLYAGDYWLVWPAVWRDLMLGRPAYGLAYRGDANREAAGAHISREIDTAGGFSVLCLNAQAGDCLSWVGTFSGPVICRQAQAVSSQAMLLKLGPEPNEMVADGRSMDNPGCGRIGDAPRGNAIGRGEGH